MGCIKQLVVKSHTIIIADYSFFKEDEMVTQANLMIEKVKKSEKPALILNLFNDCYITPAFSELIKKEALSNNLRIEKQALVWLNQPKRIILKGFNLFFNRDYQSFDTTKEAIEYLIGESVMESEIAF